MYIISKQYLSLINVSFETKTGLLNYIKSFLYTKYPIESKTINKTDILEVLKNDEKFIVCDNLNDAYKILSFLLVPHTTPNEHIEPSVKLFSTCVIFKLLSIYPTENWHLLTRNDLNWYTNKDNIPLHTGIHDYIKNFHIIEEQELNIGIVQNLDILCIREAYYFDHKGEKTTFKLT